MTKYVTISGDTWDIIAFRLYGDEFLMHKIIEANIGYADVLVFNAGVELDIPEIEIPSSRTLPPWKQ